jgi:hypothetical protein
MSDNYFEYVFRFIPKDSIPVVLYLTLLPVLQTFRIQQ